MAGMIKAAEMRLGGGGRFKKLSRELESKGAEDPAALAAWIGRRKYGKKKFQALSQHGKGKR